MHCIINHENKDIISFMSNMGYTCHNVIRSSFVSGPISSHSDVLYQKAGENTIVISACQRVNKGFLEQSGYKILIYDNLRPGYNTECKLNFIINKKVVIHNKKTSLADNCDFFNNLIEKENLKQIYVNQGYTKCSTVTVTDTAYITDDIGIYIRIKSAGMDCLLISKGQVKLDGYDYGFIGGASVNDEKGKIIFFGDFKSAEEKSRVINFIRNHDRQPIFMENKQLIDIGSAVII